MSHIQTFIKQPRRMFSFATCLRENKQTQQIFSCYKLSYYINVNGENGLFLLLQRSGALCSHTTPLFLL